MDCVEINSQAGSRRSRASRGPPKSARESQLLTPEPSGHSASSPVRADQEDYSSWEEAISINQLEELKQEIGQFSFNICRCGISLRSFAYRKIVNLESCSSQPFFSSTETTENQATAVAIGQWHRSYIPITGSVILRSSS